MDMQRLEDLASQSEERDIVRQMEVRSRVHKTIEDMKANEEAFELTDEEVRMMRAFRRFQHGCKPGAIFKWQTRPVEGVEIITETGLVRDPQEVSEQ